MSLECDALNERAFPRLALANIKYGQLSAIL